MDQLRKKTFVGKSNPSNLEIKSLNWKRVNELRGFKTFKKENGRQSLQKEAEVLPFKGIEFEG